MKNNKGQALVEFVIIMPIFLLILITIIDYSNIAFKKYSLQNDLDVVGDMYKDDKISEINSYVVENNLEISFNSQGTLEVITLSKDVKVTSPILSRVLGNPYKISIDKKIYKN